MKIEKINDNKIKITLNPGDLEERKLTIKEIATGSEKAHQLLNEMMQQANAEFGFQAEGVPLMIEAACLPDGQVVLMVSKTNPENAQTKSRGRYDFSIVSKGAPLQADIALDDPKAKEMKAAIDNFFDFAKKQVLGKIQEGELPEPSEQEKPLPQVLCYLFNSLDNLKGAVKLLKKMYSGEITIYRNPSTGSFFLLLYRGGASPESRSAGVSPESFNKACNLMSEYGSQIKNECISLMYYHEHYEELFDGCAKKAKLPAK